MTLREETLKMHKDNNGKLAVCSKVPMNKNTPFLFLKMTTWIAEQFAAVNKNPFQFN